MAWRSSPPCTVRPVLSKVISGWWSTSKKSTDRRSSSRMRFAVFTELMEIVAVAEGVESVDCQQCGSHGWFPSRWTMR
jgi:hypothetical protein